MTPTFPQLSRKPALKTRGTKLDPTLRDTFENGAEASKARYTRLRRQWDVSIDLMTPQDMTLLENFVDKIVVAGAGNFLFKDERDPTAVVNYNVRFSTIPAYVDAGNIEGQFRQNCTFTIREM